MIASVVWNRRGATSEWKIKYPAQYVELGDAGGFVVQAGDLVFSVIVFMMCEFTALGVIAYRRKAFQAELGGPAGPKTNTSILFVLLWVFYASVASWKAAEGEAADTTAMVLAVLVGIAGVIFGMVLVVAVIQFWQRQQRQADQQAKDITEKVTNNVVASVGGILQSKVCNGSNKLEASLNSHSCTRSSNTSSANSRQYDVSEVLIAMTGQIESLTETCNMLKISLGMHSYDSHPYHPSKNSRSDYDNSIVVRPSGLSKKPKHINRNQKSKNSLDAHRTHPASVTSKNGVKKKTDHYSHGSSFSETPRKDTE